MDDFGTGYGSLTYLSRYPIDVIKIDRSFVGGASAPDHGRSLLAGILALAQVVGINVTAEGVENWGQATNLREMGCPSAQGWLFSKALPPDELAALVHQTFIHP